MSGEERDAVFEQMTPETQKIAKKNDKELQKANASSLKTYYTIGKDVHVMHKAEQTYGSGYMKQLATYWGFSETTLGEYKNAAEVFDWNTIDGYAEAAQKSGFRLEISHVTYAAKLDTAAKRKEMLDKIVKERLSTRHVKLLVDTSGATAVRAAGGGRKQAPPKTPQAGFKKATQVSKNLANLLEMFPSNVFDKLEVIAPDEITKNDLALIQSFEEYVNKLGHELDAVLTLLKPAKERVEKILSKKESVAKSKADDDAYAYDDDSDADEEEEEDTDFEDAEDSEDEEDTEVDEDADDEDEEDEEDEEEEDEEDDDVQTMSDWRKEQREAAARRGLRKNTSTHMRHRLF